MWSIKGGCLICKALQDIGHGDFNNIHRNPMLLMQPFATRKSTFLVSVSVIAVFSFMIIGAAQAQAIEDKLLVIVMKTGGNLSQYTT